MELKKNAIRKGAAIFILAGVLAVSGCSGVPVPDREGEGTIHGQELQPEMDEKDKNNRSGSIENYTNTDSVDESKKNEYIIPQSLLSVAGITAEELVEDFNETYSDDYYIDKAEVNENGEVLLTLTNTQRKRYMEYKEEVIKDEIENARYKEDISVEITDDYKEMKISLGENSNSNGFIKTYMMLATQMGIYQIISGCAPEEWGLHIKVLREGKVILDTNEPNASWQLNNEDFGE